jgi:hypothetical protein
LTIVLAASWTDPVTAVGTGLSAIAAGLAVWVAILKPNWRRPQLEILKPQRDRELVVADLSSGIPSAWLRLAVAVEPGREAAEEVEIVILNVKEIEPRSGKARSVRNPMLSGLSLGLSSSEGRSVAAVPAGGYRIYDLASTYRDAKGGDTPLVIEVARYAKPVDRRHELTWGVTAIELAVVAKNADSVRYIATISYDGNWGDEIDDIWSHLQLLSLERQ